jgi:hypothetical protein
MVFYLSFQLFNQPFSLESIPHLVGLLNEAIHTSDRRSSGLEAREICKGLSKLSVADDNKNKVKQINFFFRYKKTKHSFFRRFFLNQNYSTVY